MDLLYDYKVRSDMNLSDKSVARTSMNCSGLYS